MKRGLCFLSVATFCAVTNAVQAQGAPPPYEVPPPAGVGASAGGAPAARVGFQMAIRTGYMVPMGNARGANPGSSSGDYKMSDGFSGQVPIFVELGGKVTPSIFVGGYLGFGFGGAAGQIDTLCKQGSLSCAAVGLRFGAEIQYHILPAGASNPWIGYGFGFESIALGMSQGGQTATDGFGGLEFAHLMGGVDFRLSPGFGVGPFLDFSAGTYTTYRAEVPGFPTQDGDVPTTSTHEWLAFGVRGTFFP